MANTKSAVKNIRKSERRREHNKIYRSRARTLIRRTRLLIEQGENIKYIQTQLGHSSPSITLDVYAHLMKAVNQEAACRLEKTILEKSGSKMVATNKNDATV